MWTFTPRFVAVSIFPTRAGVREGVGLEHPDFLFRAAEKGVEESIDFGFFAGNLVDEPTELSTGSL